MEPLTVPTKQSPGASGSGVGPGSALPSATSASSTSSERPPNGRNAKSGPPASASGPSPYASSGSNPDGSSGRRHRRISSEDLNRRGFPDPSGGAGGASFMYPYPPAYQQQMNLGPNDAASLARERSWSGSYSPFTLAGAPASGSGNPNKYPPSPLSSSSAAAGFNRSFPPSGANSPFPDHHQQPALHLPPHLQSQQHPNDAPPPRRNKRKNAAHRRVHSYSGGPSYGSLDMMVPPNINSNMSTAPPPPLPAGRNRADFSPRNEFMKLASSYRAPSPQQHIGSMSPRRSPGDTAIRSVPPSPNSASIRASAAQKMDDHLRVSFSPSTPLNGIDSTAVMGSSRNGMVYGMDPVGSMTLPHPFAPSPAGMVPQSPSVDPTGGEAVFLANKQNTYKKASSSRKMHMRQQSAQLFMEDTKGVEQNPACRDIVFLLLFLFHILGVVFLGNTYGFEGLLYHEEGSDDHSVTLIYRNVVYVSLLSGVFAITVSALTLLLMTLSARKIVQVALVLTISLSFAWGTIGIGLSPKKVVPATGIVALALSVAYTFIVWDRIPFAAANLNAALVGVRANPGTILVAFFFQFVVLGWTIYFAYVAIGVYDAIQVGDIDLSTNGAAAVYVVLGLSFYWTYNVFLNIVQVTVASVIGTWWYTPDGDTTHRTNDLHKAICRSSFYALGSICYGSITVGPARLLRQISALFRPSGDDSPLLCLHECVKCIQTCIASCIDSLSMRFNPWSFSYVGLYGYGLVDGGMGATDLFVKRGWTTIVSDDLIPNVLLLTSLVIGGVTGCFAYFIEGVESLSFSSLEQPASMSFMCGVVVGLVVTIILFGLISSSVNAVVVCFAASPVDFERCHPQLSQDMRNSWREVWPGCMDVLDMRMAVGSYMDPPPGGIPNGELRPLI